MGDPFASTSAPASDHSPKSAASASGAKALRGSLGVEAQSQGKFAQSSVPAPRRAALEAKASGVDVAAPRSENEDSADDDAFERKRERTHPSAPASAVEDLLVHEGSLGGGGRQLEGEDDDTLPPFCILRNTTVCWGNWHRYVERKDLFGGFDVGFWSKPALADLDDDGDLDLVVGEQYGLLYYYENVGNATSPSYEAVTGTASPFDGIDVRYGYSAPALADLDGDGDVDLVVGEAYGALYYFENVGNATSPSYEAVTGSANPFNGIDVGSDSALALADLDGDGDLDLAVGENHGGTLYYFENVGNARSPSYAAVTGTASPFDGIDFSSYSAPAFADLDGDGDPDLVVGDYYGGTLLYYENVGFAWSPSYEAAIQNPFGGIDYGSYIMPVPAFGDVDGDGDLDLVVGARADLLSRGDLSYYEIVGPATSPSYAVVTGAANPLEGLDVGGSSAPAFGDLDGDDDLDLVVGDETGVPGEEIGALNYYEIVGSTAYYYNEIVGSTALPTYAVVTRTAGPFADIDVGSGWEHSAPDFGDLDGDEDLDLVVGEENGFLYYYENVGNAAAPSYMAVTGNENPFDGIDVGSGSAPAFVDLNGDSDLDLVVGMGTGVLFYLENVGSAASPSYVAVTGSDSPFDGIDVGSKSAPAFGDVDGDGDLDLLVGANNRFLYYYVNFAPTHAPTLAPSPLPTTPAPSPLPTTRIDDDDDDDDAMSVATILFAASGWCVALVVIVAALAVAAKRRRTPPLEPAVAHPTKEAPAAQMA